MAEDFNSADVGLPANDRKKSQDETLIIANTKAATTKDFFIPLTIKPTKIIRIKK